MIDDKKQQILDLVSEYIKEKEQSKKWIAGEDWIQYSGPFYDDKEYVAGIETLLNGWFILGEKGREFEYKFAKELGKQDGIFVNSGSSANLLMVSLLRTRRGGNVPVGSKFITPVVCFPTTLNPLIQNGFKPVFVDVTLPNLNLDLDQVEDLLKNDHNKEIKGIIFAHVLGNPPDMDRLLSLVDQYNLIYLEDTCDGLGSKWDGKPLGSFGKISTCSFFPAHHMTTGEGGFVGCNLPMHRMALASLRDWGRACYCNTKKPGKVLDGTACNCRFNTWFKQYPEITYDHRYVFDEVGYNLKPTEMQASIGLQQIDKLEYMHSRRKYNFNRMLDIFKRYEKYFHLPFSLEKADTSWFGFLLTLKDGSPFTKDEIIDYLESCKIQTRSYFTGNALFHPAYSSLFAEEHPDPKEEFPIATKTTIDTFFLGVFPGITDEQIDYIDKCVVSFMEKYI